MTFSQLKEQLEVIYSRPRDYLGFTFVEILLVLAVLVVITSISIPNFSKSYNTLLLQTTVNDIAYLMRYAQSRAIIKKKEIRFILGDQGMSYRIYQQGADTEKVSQEIDESPSGYNPIRGRWGRTFNIPGVITIETDNPAINFYPDGQVEKGRINVCYKSKCMLISTEERRGRVQIFKLQ